MSWLPIDGHAHQELQTKAVFFTSFGLRPHQGTYFEVQDLHKGERAAYHDLMINTDACKDYIKKGALDDVEDIMQRSEFDGMMTANQSLQRLVESGQVEADKAIAVSPRPNELSQALRGRG